MDFDDNDVLHPLPRVPLSSSPKRMRRQSPFDGPAFVSSTVVASPGPAEVISTLIDSLTAISESAREQYKRDFVVQDPRQDLGVDYQDSDPQLPHDLNRSARDYNSDTEYVSDGEVAAAPVIRFARSPPTYQKAKKELRPLYANTIFSGQGLVVRKSHQSQQARPESPDMGQPSIERVNGSNTSLPVPFISGRDRSPRKASTPEPGSEQSSTRPVLSQRTSADTPILDNTATKRNIDEEKENRSPLRTPEPKDPSGADESIQPSTPGSQGPTINALNPLNRADLRESLIPNRRSSIRHSARNSQDSSESHRRSMGSRDLRELNIDNELIESDDSTVRRIRELQEAREKRQIEWRREAKRSEKAAKRHSAPSPKSVRSSALQASKLAVTEVVVETPEPDAAPNVSACLSASDLAGMPALMPSSSSDSPAASPVTPAVETSKFSAFPPPAPQRIIATPFQTAPDQRSPQHPPRASNHFQRSSTSYSTRPETGLNEAKSIGEEVEAFVSAPRLTQKIRHPRTGRTVAFSEVGDPQGFVVFCCVGMGLTRFVTAFYDELARTLKLRLITPDRPGVGESQAVPERLSSPLTWVDDIAVICDSLEIERFSLLAHSAGSIYALASALKMPQYVRGRIHLLAPWIPPSQMPKGAAIGPDSQPIANLPMSHRILSVLPAPILKVANSRFLSATAAYADQKPPKHKKLRNLENLEGQFTQSLDDLTDPSLNNLLRDLGNGGQSEQGSPDRNRTGVSCYQANNNTLDMQRLQVSGSPEPRASSAIGRYQAISPGPSSPRLTPEARQVMYNSALTHRIWALSTLNANPATDLMICLERRKTIGFRYAEVTRSVVIHHGAKDTRVPLDNVRWLQSIMKRCELRILDEEGHGLMASASVMSGVLGEIGKEWEEWHRITQEKEKKKRDDSSARSFRSVDVR